MTSPDLFISHSSADSKTAEELVAALEKGGLTCWVAPRDIPMGSAYQVAIVDAIEHCRAMLLVFSEAANQSEHVLREVELAAQGKKPVYPLRIDRSDPVGGLKYMLANKQWVERKALGDRLVETIVHLVLGAAAAPDEKLPRPAPPPARPSRPLVAAGAAVAVLALIAGTGWLVAPWSSPRPAEPGAPAVAETAPGDVRQPPGVRPPATPAPIIVASAPADPSALAEGVHLFKECELCPVMAVVPAGQSLIGSPNGESGHDGSESPQQPVVIRQPFSVGRSEISFDEWMACVDDGGCNGYRPDDQGWGYGKLPVINVSWRDARAYVQWLSRKTKATYRLLSESEWEYAARGCTAPCAFTPFWFGSQDLASNALTTIGALPMRRAPRPCRHGAPSRSIRRSRIHSGSSMCTATSANGSRIAGISTSSDSPRTAVRGRPETATATWCAAAHGRTSRRTCAWRAGAGRSAPKSSRRSDSASPVRWAPEWALCLLTELAVRQPARHT